MNTTQTERPVIIIKGGFLKSFEKNVAVIRALGFEIQIKIFHSPSTSCGPPLTFLVENVHGQDVQFAGGDNGLNHIIRSETSLMFEVIGGMVKKITLYYPHQSEEFDFLFVGDVHGMFHHFEDIIQAANTLDPLFIMSNGDMTHSGRLEDYHLFLDMLGQANVPVFTSIGNHDKRARGGRAAYRAMLAPFYYAFSVKNVRCIVLDSSRKRGLQKFQYKWLERELQLAKQKDERILIFLHRPPFCPKYNYLAFSASSNAWRFLSLMETYDVEMVFSSHIHVFSEFYRRGIRYMVTGGGGGALWQPQNIHHYLHVFVKHDSIEARIIQLPTPEAKVSQRIKDVIKFNWEYHVARNKRIKQAASVGTTLLLGRTISPRRSRLYRGKSALP